MSPDRPAAAVLERGAARVDADAAVGRFREIVALPTVSRHDESTVDWTPFDRFRSGLATWYPALHSAVEHLPTVTRALLFRWPGRTAGAPTVLMAHYDVVAVGGSWTSDPFAAELDGEGAEAVIRGRGVIDDKASLVGILEAVDALAAAGHVPESDVYLAFSHNEEVLGDGTPEIVATLAQLGVRPRLVLDEGGIVGESIFPGVTRPVAQIGVSEKGTGAVRVRVTAPGGHASVPPRDPATVRLARAVVRIQEAGETPFLSDVTRRLIAELGAVATGPLAEAAEALRAGDDAAAISRFAAVSPDARAMVHSSAVVTMLAAGHTVNAVPEEAVATVNLRICVGDTVAAAIERLRAAVDDPAIELDVVEGGEPSPVSPSEGPEWRLVTEAIARVYGDVLVSPYVNNGGTDSRNYTGICDTVYRFSPCDMTLVERSSIHAIDEHLRVSSFVEGCAFYLDFVGRL